MPSLGAAGSFTGTAENSPIASSAIIYTSRVSSSSRGDIRIYTIRVVTLRGFLQKQRSCATHREPVGPAEQCIRGTLSVCFAAAKKRSLKVRYRACIRVVQSERVPEENVYSLEATKIKKNKR